MKRFALKTPACRYRVADQSSWRWRFIAAKLRNEAVIAYPTEGVWGLGCMPESDWAVARLLNMKSRSWRQGLILLAGEIGQLTPYLEGLVGDYHDAILQKRDGPTTYLIPHNGFAPGWITGEHKTLAIRVTNHPVVQAICNELDGPIVSTSANPSGKPPANSSFRVRQYFGSELDLIVPGQLGGASGASEIISLITGDVIRGRQ